MGPEWILGGAAGLLLLSLALLWSGWAFRGPAVRLESERRAWLEARYAEDLERWRVREKRLELALENARREFLAADRLRDAVRSGDVDGVLRLRPGSFSGEGDPPPAEPADPGLERGTALDLPEWEHPLDPGEVRSPGAVRRVS